MKNGIFSNQLNSKKTGKSQMRVFSIDANNRQKTISEIAKIIPDHYTSNYKNLLKQYGKKATAKHLEETKFPSELKTRSGELGEILAAEYVEQEMPYDIPIKKLRYKDSRNMPMRGDDIIGIIFPQDEQAIRFLKGEAKSRQSLSQQAINEARKALEKEDEFPTPHSLSFIAEQLIKGGYEIMGDQINKAIIEKRITLNDVEHLIFTLSENRPGHFLYNDLENYNGDIKQNNIGVEVEQHQDFIAAVYEAIGK